MIHVDLEFLKEELKIKPIDASEFMVAFLFYAPIVKKETKVVTETSVDIDTAIRITDYRLGKITEKNSLEKYKELRNKLYNYKKAPNAK